MKKTNQQGFALLVSMILLIVLTLIGFSIANKGKLSAQVSRTTSRYEAVSAAAEAEMYRLINLISSATAIIETGAGVLCDTGNCAVAAGAPTEITQVWSNSALGALQTPPNIMPDFSDFSDPIWNSGITGTTQSQYDVGGTQLISTRAFVQELVRRESTSASGAVELSVEYLVTVKAFAQNPGDAATDERETIVLQSSYSMHFII